MARLLGVEIPNEKRVEASLPYIYGIGRVTATKILEEAGVDKNIRTGELTDEQLGRIANAITGARQSRKTADLRKIITYPQIHTTRPTLGPRQESSVQERGVCADTAVHCSRGGVYSAVQCIGCIAVYGICCILLYLPIQYFNR